MPNLAHRILAAFMVLWMPFCCCQVRAAAHAAAHAAAGNPTAAWHADAPCCTGAACCGADESAGEEPAASCCAPDPGRGQEPAKGKDCCTSCKERVPPPAGAVLLPTDSHGTDLPPCQGHVLATTAADGPAFRVDSSHGDAGPPAKPSGRDALARHSVLLI